MLNEADETSTTEAPHTHTHTHEHADSQFISISSCHRLTDPD